MILQSMCAQIYKGISGIFVTFRSLNIVIIENAKKKALQLTHKPSTYAQYTQTHQNVAPKH